MLLKVYKLSKAMHAALRSKASAADGTGAGANTRRAGAILFIRIASLTSLYVRCHRRRRRSEH